MDLKPATPQREFTYGNLTGIRFLPESSEQIAAVLRDSSSPMALSLEEAADLSEPRWLDLSAMNRVRTVRQADLMINVETGITMGELREALAPLGQDFPLHYPDPMMLLEVLARDEAALETGLSGYPRDYVLKCEAITADGAITHYGADVVKNVTGYDLNKLYVGSHNTLALLSAVTLKLQGMPQARRGYFIGIPDGEQALAQARRFLNAGLPLSQCEIIPNPASRLGLSEDLDAEWALWLEFSGENAALDSTANAVQQHFGHAIDPLPESSTRHLQERLRHWPDWTLELAVPAGSLAEAYQLCGQTDLCLLQLRPAAGLIYLTLPQTPNHGVSDDGISKAQLAALSQLDRQVRTLGGFLRAFRAPKDGLMLIRNLNRPADPLQQNLCDRLKREYDPRHLLYSRLLPTAEGV